jgi:hypothetical protein
VGELILVDDNKDAAMLAAIEDAFRGLGMGRIPAVRLTQKPVFRDSKIDETVQLADMVMGAVRAHFEGQSEWYDHMRGGGRDLGVMEFTQCSGSDDLVQNMVRLG